MGKLVDRYIANASEVVLFFSNHQVPSRPSDHTGRPAPPPSNGRCGLDRNIDAKRCRTCVNVASSFLILDALLFLCIAGVVRWWLVRWLVDVDEKSSSFWRMPRRCQRLNYTMSTAARGQQCTRLSTVLGGHAGLSAHQYGFDGATTDIGYRSSSPDDTLPRKAVTLSLPSSPPGGNHDRHSRAHTAILRMSTAIKNTPIQRKPNGPLIPIGQQPYGHLTYVQWFFVCSALGLIWSPYLGENPRIQKKKD
jgi:hypothetical protein